jgi:methylglutaconyl-CoA hydratase
MNESLVDLSFVSLPGGAENRIAVLTLNRPTVSNAFDSNMLRALSACFKKVHDESVTIRALVLRGSGKNFCAGADIKWMRDSAKASAEQNYREADELGDLFYHLYTLPFPTIAVIHGRHLGEASDLSRAVIGPLRRRKLSFV